MLTDQEIMDVLKAPEGYKFSAKGITKIDVWPHGGHWFPLYSLEQVKAVIAAHKVKAIKSQPAVPQGWKPIDTAPKDKFVLVACPSGYTTTPWMFTTGILHSDYKVGRWVDHANDDLSDWGMTPAFWRDDIITPDSPAAPPQPVTLTDGWDECKRISELPEVDEALRLFAEGETTEDQAVAIVQAIIAALREKEQAR